MKPYRRRPMKSNPRTGRRYYGPNRRRQDAYTDPIIELATEIRNRIAAEDVDGFGWEE
jgi:hypothetical protein